MPIGPVVDGMAIIASAGLLMAAAVSDARHFLIPNRICVALILLYPVHVLAVSVGVPGLASPNWIAGVAVALAVFAAGCGLFAAGMLGGGDVKLLAAVALWAGPEGTPLLLIITALAGGVIGLWVLARGVLARAHHLSPADGPDDRTAVLKRDVPYGVGIACAGITIAGQLLNVTASAWSS